MYAADTSSMLVGPRDLDAQQPRIHRIRPRTSVEIPGAEEDAVATLFFRFGGITVIIVVIFVTTTVQPFVLDIAVDGARRRGRRVDTR